ncbi:hypothetical protein DFH07DRAFT_850840 [Mycena maculata]|uniref:Uncharacterized protein n=1 Tax=Mycena maculata TaxID=230809 RepID=A0AAD7HUY2_9AGAR|nr:hypothetical protein DFH07DRAFT_850840 [Mycena maculata]
MPRRSKATKQEPVVIDLSTTHGRLTKDALLVLQRYVDHGTRLPTVSSKTSYKDIWKHTKKFQMTRKTMSVLAEKIRNTGVSFTCPDCDLPKEKLQAFLAAHSPAVDELLDACDEMAALCAEFEEQSEADLAKLQEEVKCLKVATKSKERRDLLLELTRAMPIIKRVKDAVKMFSAGLKAIQHEINVLNNGSEISFDWVVKGWEPISSGVQFLA